MFCRIPPNHFCLKNDFQIPDICFEIYSFSEIHEKQSGTLFLENYLCSNTIVIKKRFSNFLLTELHMNLEKFEKNQSGIVHVFNTSLLTYFIFLCRFHCALKRLDYHNNSLKYQWITT